MLKPPPFSLDFVPFPAECEGNVYGIIGQSRNGYKIVIDSAQDEATQQKALRHELAHLILKHPENLEADLSDLEAEAEEYAANMTGEEVEYLLTFRRA